MLDDRSPKELVKDAEDLAEALTRDGEVQGMPRAELIQIVEITLRLLKATYPGRKEDVAVLSRMADTAFQVVAQRPEWVH